jgi:hypothetical protein
LSNPFPYLEKILTPEQLTVFQKTFVELGSPDISYPDTADFLDKIKHIPHVIMTYGKNPVWQRMKIRAAGYKGALIITDTPSKGHLIAQNQASGIISLEIGSKSSLSAKTAILIDDKPDAFIGLPPTCSGFLIQRPDAKYMRIPPNFPNNVVTVSSLDEIPIIRA